MVSIAPDLINSFLSTLVSVGYWHFVTWTIWSHRVSILTGLLISVIKRTLTYFCHNSHTRSWLVTTVLVLAHNVSPWSAPGDTWSVARSRRPSVPGLSCHETEPGAGADSGPRFRPGARGGQLMASPGRCCLHWLGRARPRYTAVTDNTQRISSTRCSLERRVWSILD